MDYEETAEHQGNSPLVYCNPSRVILDFSSRNARNWIASTKVSSMIWINC